MRVNEISPLLSVRVLMQWFNSYFRGGSHRNTIFQSELWVHRNFRVSAFGVPNLNEDFRFLFWASIFGLFKPNRNLKTENLSYCSQLNPTTKMLPSNDYKYDYQKKWVPLLRFLSFTKCESPKSKQFKENLINFYVTIPPGSRIWMLLINVIFLKGCL